MAGRANAPLTPRGALALAVSTGLLWEGYGRGELIATVLGLTLAATWTYALLSATAAAFLWRGFRGGIETRGGTEYRVYPASKSSWPRGARRLAAVRYRLIVRRRKSVPQFYSLLFDLPEAEKWHNPSLPPRGTYDIVQRGCEIRDFLGFFSIPAARVQEEEGSAILVPAVPAPVEARSVQASTNGVSEGKSTYLRSEELYEVRPYLPGDDPRKINWKVWAHSGELALREGELLPPPSEEYAILFWSPVDKRNLQERERLFEELIQRAAGTCLRLLGEGKNLRFPQGENTLVRHDDRDAGIRVLEALAEPSREAASREWPVLALGSRSTTIVFALPPGPDQAFQPTAFRGAAVFTGPVKRKPGDAPQRLSLATLCLEPRESLTERPGVSLRAIEAMGRILRREGIDAVPI